MKLSRFYHVRPFSAVASHFATALIQSASLRKQIGGSVCESNAPTTSEMPSAGFEDRDRHRTTNASVLKRVQPSLERLRLFRVVSQDGRALTKTIQSVGNNEGTGVSKFLSNGGHRESLRNPHTSLQ